MNSKWNYSKLLEIDSPVYKHDCSACVWLGTHNHKWDGRADRKPWHVSDYYICGDLHGFGETHKRGHVTLVVRHSDEGAEYMSQSLRHVVDEWLNDIRYNYVEEQRNEQ